MPSKKDLTAPCGIDCFNCELFEANLTETMKIRMAAMFKIEPEQVVCRGCRVQKGCRLHFSHCDTLDCVTSRGFEFCFECRDFPCNKLQPAADGADKLPHNLKVFNLNRIQKIGVEAWAQSEALEIRQKYFKGKFKIGSGPSLEKD